MTFFEFIFSAIGSILLFYIAYLYYSTPFRILKETKKIRKFTKEIIDENNKADKIAAEIITDPIFKQKIEPIRQSLTNGTITYDKYKEIYTEIMLERYYELYKNSEIESEEEQISEEQLEKNREFKKIILYVYIVGIISILVFLIAKYITRSQLN